MGLPSTIAIDGPSGAGKSVVGERLARVLGYRYVDTGALYRAVTLLAMRCGVPFEDQERLGTLAAAAPLRIEPDGVADGRQYTVLIGDEDVTWEIRDPAVEQNVSAVSAVPSVRSALIDQQRRIAQSGGTVMVGRDITTVVLPKADLKIFLTASPEERARRRHRQLTEQGRNLSFAVVLGEIRRRDAFDSSRAAAPLRIADDAIVVESDQLSIDQVVGRIRDLAEEAHRPCTAPPLPSS